MDKETLVVHRKNFGQRLKDLRESQGISLEGISHSTRISSVFIKALEEGEFEKLPGQVFGRGFVKSLAKTMGASEADWALAFNDACGSEASARAIDKKGGGHGTSLDRENEGRYRLNQARRVAIGYGGITPEIRKLFRRYLANPMGLIILVGVALVVTISIAIQKSGGLGIPRLVQDLKERIQVDGADKQGLGRLVTATAVPASSKEPSAQWEISWHRIWSPYWSQDEAIVQENAGVLLHIPRVTGLYDGPISSVLLKDPNDPLGISFTESQLAESPAILIRQNSSGNFAPLDSKESQFSEAIEDQAQDFVAGSTDAPTEVIGLQTVKLNVKEPLKIKIGIDGEAMKVVDLKIDQHLFQFKDRLDLLVYDASALTIQFNGDDLGSLGQKGRIRRLTFKSRNDLPEGKKDSLLQ
jgi:transcriptional regulator with XRE-family HTH domain